MATGGEESEYETDPEEATLPLAMRRREASDDEDGDDEGSMRKPSERVVFRSDGESDGQGGAHVYEDEVSEIEEEEEEGEDEDYYAAAEEVFYGKGSEGVLEEERALEVDGTAESGGEESRSIERNHEGEEEKKESEPFSVPTAGAFYMHDDRFEGNGNGRHRRNGRRRLWESKDNRAWLHDRFEEMSLQDARYEQERRNNKGRFRGRGRYQRRDNGHLRGNGSRAFDDMNNRNRNKVFRGRGPRRYEAPAKNDREMPVMQERQSRKSIDTASNSNLGRLPPHTSSVKHDPVLPQKHAFASSLNSASPPFYPSGSSNQEKYITQKREMPNGGTDRNFQSFPVGKQSMPTSHSSTSLRGKDFAEPNGLESSFMNDSNLSFAGKQLSSTKLQPSGSSMLFDARHFAQNRSQGRGQLVGGQLNFGASASPNNLGAQTQIPVSQQRAIQNLLQPISRGSFQQLVERHGSGTQASSSNMSESRQMESSSGSSKSKNALAGKDKDSSQGSGKGSFLYGATQVIGATGPMGLATHGDQSFPALLPVMQFGGQHHGGLGVPAVGMALPGYVAQPQLGFGNSEMTWLPVLAGATGGLGASYCSPYIAADGGFYNRVSGQTSSMGESKETSANKPSNAWKPPQKPELVSDEFGQRQNKPRRYSEMSFSQ